MQAIQLPQSLALAMVPCPGNAVGEKVSTRDGKWENVRTLCGHRVSERETGTDPNGSSHPMGAVPLFSEPSLLLLPPSLPKSSSSDLRPGSICR